MLRKRKVHCKACDKVGYVEVDLMSNDCPDYYCNERNPDAKVEDMGNVEISREDLKAVRATYSDGDDD